MSSNLFDPKMYKHVSSDKHKTTLKHKRGHIITVAHNAISPKMRASLEALSAISGENATEGQKQEDQDQDQYGKILHKAKGGEVAGDHKHGEYTLKHKSKFIPKDKINRADHTYHTVTAHDKSGEQVGKYEVAHWHGAHKDGAYPQHAVTASEHQRKGLASAAYKLIQDKAGVPLSRPVGEGLQSEDAKKLWDNKKFAEGGDVEQKTFMGQPVYGTGRSQPKAPEHEGTMPGANDEEWPLPSQTSVGKAIQAKKDAQAQPEAKGGKVHSNDHLDSGSKPGVSTQGQDVRRGHSKKQDGRDNTTEHGYAQSEAKGRIEMERKIKPKLMAGGGYAESPAAAGSTARGAYDAGLPCLNPNCKSHGRPHPNCRCYAGMANGGEVSKLRYCAHGQKHQEGCEYAKGGQVGMYAEGGVPYGMRESDIPKDEHQTEQEISQYEQQNPSRLEQSNNERMEARTPSPMIQPGMPGYDESHTPINDTEDPPEDGTQTDPRMYAKIHGDDNYGRNPAEAPQPQAKPMANAPGADTVQPGSDTVEVQQPQQMQEQPQEQEITPAHVADSIMRENKAWEQDLMNGHIQPKTYHDLMFHNKDGSEKSTLGKISSIMGLMLSGLGAGLAHQPNMAMQMMDNTIKNDLEAQMKSKDNAQNFYKINQARLLNDANVKSVLESADYTKAQKDAIVQGTGIKAYAGAYAAMNSAAVHDGLEKLKRMPEGPEKQKFAQLMMVVAKGAEEANAKAAITAAAGIHSLSMFGVNNDEGSSNLSPEDKSERQFQNEMQLRENSGDKAGADAIRDRHIKGIEGLATRPIPEDKRNKVLAMQTLDNKVRDVLTYAQQHVGSIDPKVIATAKQKAEELTAFYNDSVGTLGMTEGRLRWLEKQIKENPTSFITQLMGNNSRLAEIRDSNLARKGQLLDSLGFQGVKSGSKSQPIQGKDGKMYIQQGKYMVPVR